MTSVQLRKDLATLKEGDQKVQDSRYSMCEARGVFSIPYLDLLEELNKHQWYLEYIGAINKYQAIFEENKVLLEPYECSSLEDFKVAL